MVLDTNERQITPLSIWGAGQIKNASILRINSWCGYDFKNNYGELYYQLAVDDNPKTVIASGNILVTSQVFQDWMAAGDIRLFEYLANQLGLTLVV